MRRTHLGLLAMAGSFLLSTVIGLGSLVAMQGKLDTTALTAQPLSLPTLLVSCLDPLAILLEIAAIVLIVLDSRQAAGAHRRTAWIAAAFFVAWAVANVGGFLPLSFLAMQSGSLALMQAGQAVKAVAALLQYAVPFLLAFGLTRKWLRALLWVALVLTVVGNFAVVVLPIAGMELVPTEIPGGTLYAPRYAVDYTAGVYPVLLTVGYVGGWLYLVAYVILAWQAWKRVRSTAAGEAASVV